MKEVLEQVEFSLRDPDRKQSLEEVLLKHASAAKMIADDNKDKVRRVATHFANEMAAKILGQPSEISDMDALKQKNKELQDELNSAHEEINALNAVIKSYKDKLPGDVTPPAAQRDRSPSQMPPGQGSRPGPGMSPMSKIKADMKADMDEFRGEMRSMMGELLRGQPAGGSQLVPPPTPPQPDVSLDDFERTRGMNKLLQDVAFKGTNVAPAELKQQHCVIGYQRRVSTGIHLPN